MHEAIRALVREKLRDGRLPLDSIRRFWGGPAAGEICDACDQPIPRQQVIMEGITSTVRSKTTPRHGSTSRNNRPIQFHVRCFQIWDEERREAPAASQAS